MTAIAITPRKISATWDRGANPLNYQTAVEVELGDVVYLDANNQLRLAVGNLTAVEANAFGMVTGVPNQYAETTAPALSYVTVTSDGPVFGFSGLIDGQVLYVSKTAPGGLDDTRPTGGVYDYIFARAQGADAIFVRPGQSTPASV